MVVYFNSIVLVVYKWIIMPILIRRLRKREQINVAFVIAELGSWKTENLYTRMLSNSRFNVKLFLAHEQSAPYAFDIVKSYLDNKKHAYIILERGEKIGKYFKPNIIFYQKPYDGIIDLVQFYQANLSSLFCFCSYTFWNRRSTKINNVVFLKYVWQLYIENPSVYTDLEPIMHNHAENMVVTGVPMMDVLLKDKKEFENPWRQNGKKRIIYAPHHTISPQSSQFKSPFYYSTFFIYAEFILQMAQKYKDSVQWAFKPHPLLRTKLNEIWGVEKTDNYFLKWQTLENAQVCEGEYIGLFKHSDAMIHDCGSFKVEYLYTGNPVMYLMNDNQEYDYPNTQTQKALDLHYKAFDSKDIETFIVNVINGVDSSKDSREEFVAQYLTPPYNKSACDNIINAILGKEEYANYNSK